jgi:Uma2 family endonuclease
MIAHPLPPPLSVEEYLELEENSTIKHEYLAGYVYAMAGGSVDHGVIAVNVLAALRPQLRGGSCRVYNSEVRVRLGPRRFVYPDVSVSCDPRDYASGRRRSSADLVLSLRCGRYSPTGPGGRPIAAFYEDITL